MILSGIGKTKVLFVFDVICTLLLLLVNMVLLYCNVSSPVLIACVFVCMQLLLRNICPYIYLRYSEGVMIVSKTTIMNLFKIILHVIVIVVFVAWSARFYKDISVICLQLIISGILFYILLVVSGIVLKINYLSSLKRLIRR